MPKDFDELLSKDREFTVRGQTFHYRDLSPEQVFADADVNLDNGASVWDLTDRQILRYLPDSEHEAWKALRTDKENPVTLKQINELVAWLWEEATGHPLPLPEPSQVGLGSSDTSSGARPRSRVVTPKK